MKKIKTILILFALLLLSTFLQPAAAQNEQPSGVTKTDTVYVAHPTGERETDRASILVALEEVEPGGTVQFAPGTYLMGGEIIRVTVPRVTLTGHAEGTTLRGCYPDEFPWQDITEFGNNCNGLELAGGWQTVRDLTFEHAFWALHVGCCWESQPHMMPGEGGHLIEGNTFRSNSNAVRVHGYWTEPTVIRNNRLLNNWHSVAIYGNTVHLLDNDIAVPEPEEVQLLGFPMDGVHLARPFDLHESVEGVGRTCENNVVAGNRIDGVTEGIMMTANEPGIICHNNVIRDNTIAVRRAHPPTMPGFVPVHEEADSTVIGVPLALRGVAGESTLEDNLIEGNIIVGAEGLGIEVRNASHNRIVNNNVTRVARREPFPGNAFAALPILGGAPDAWRDANGSGIWISTGSDGNEIIGNTFEDIASYAVFVEGDSNRVELNNKNDEVNDLGKGNQVSNTGNTAESELDNNHQPKYESKFVETRGIRLQYMDFGGEGLPVIFLQDFHDYFSIEEEETHHAAWLSRFADEYRVLAPVRRGWGKSDDTGYGYDVATQSEDLLGLMDALKINRAVLVGRIPANQDMTWIAEHHPERVSGLIYIGNPRVFAYPNDPDAIAFNENYDRGICDADVEEAEKWEKRTGARQAWRPHFYTDPVARIDIPTLRFYNPVWEGRSLSLRRLEPESIKQLALSDHCGDEQAQRYFSELAADEKRLENLRQIFRETDPSRKLNETMERAFGSNMKTVVEEELMGLDEIYNFHFPHMRSFLKEIEQLESEEE